ncbi:MAG: YidB family protein [Pseudomonadota bacterium]
MGLFDIAAGMLTGNAGQEQANDPKSMLLQAVIGMVTNSAQNGGLQSVLAQFHAAGFADKIASWIGTGSNLPISAEQIAQVLGGGHLEQMASAAGISTESAAGHLSEMLPGLIDKMTPDGKLPDGGAENLAGMLGQFLQHKA